MKLVNLVVLNQLDASPKVGDVKEALTFYVKPISTAPNSPFEMWLTDEDGKIKGNVGNITDLKDVSLQPGNNMQVVYNPDTKGLGLVPAFNILDATAKNADDLYNILQISDSKNGSVTSAGMTAKVSIQTDRGLREYAKSGGLSFRYAKDDVVRFKRSAHDVDFMLLPYHGDRKIGYLINPTDFFEIDSSKTFGAAAIPLQKISPEPFSISIKINNVDFGYTEFDIDGTNIVESLFLVSQNISSDGKFPLPKIGNYSSMQINLSSNSGIEREVNWMPNSGPGSQEVRGLKITSLKINGVEAVNDQNTVFRDLITLTNPALKPGVNTIEVTAIP